MTRNRLMIVLAIVVQTMFSQAADAQQNGTGAMTVQVVNVYNYQPIEDASVKVAGPADKTATTNGNGSFKISDLLPGKYTLDVSAPGYDTGHYEDILVIADITTNLFKIVLYPSD